MGFPWSKILNIVTFGLGIADDFVPGLSLIGPVIVAVEKAFQGQPGSGGKKKKLVMDIVMPMLKASEGLSGKDFVNDDEFEKGVSKMIDGYVHLANAFSKEN